MLHRGLKRLVEPFPSVSVPNRLGPRVEKVVWDFPGEPDGRVRTNVIVANLQNRVPRYQLGVPNQLFAKQPFLVPIEPKTPDIAPHEHVTPKGIQADRFHDPKRLGQPYPQDAIVLVLFAVGVDVHLALPKGSIVSLGEGQIGQLHGDNEGAIQSVLTVLLHQGHLGRKDNDGVLYGQHGYHPLLVVTRWVFGVERKVGRHYSVLRLLLLLLLDSRFVVDGKQEPLVTRPQHKGIVGHGMTRMSLVGNDFG